MNPPGGANTGVSRGRPVRPSNGRNRPGGGQGQQGPQNAPQGLPQASTAMPWDSLSTSEEAGAYRNAEDKLAGLRGNWEARQRWYGIDPQFANNPYSQASLLQRQREIGKRGTLNSAGNQLYAGSTVNRLGGVDRSYSEGYSHLNEGYEAERAREEREETATQHQLQSEQEQAQAEAIQRAQEAAPEPAPVNEAGPQGGGGNKPRRKKRRKN